MEDFVAAVKVFSEDKNWNELKEYINESAGLIAKNVSKIDSAISALDPEVHTMGYLGLILFKVSLPNYGDFELLFMQIQKLIEVGNKVQIQQAVDKFCHVCHFFTKCLIDQSKAFRGILLMSEAILKAQNHPSELTSVHADLMQLCLASKCLKPAVNFLNIDITDVNGEFGHFDAKMFLLYHYYGGMVYLALKQYHNALFFFQIAVTTPAMVVSHIMLEAYKKYVLVSIFLHGKIDANDVMKNYFNHQINSVAKMRLRIIFNFIVKCLYVVVNIGSFALLDMFLHYQYYNYGIAWIRWARDNSSLSMDFDFRTAPTPGNAMLPTFGLCDIHEARSDSLRTYQNRVQMICEISSNILYQYVFLVLWFVLIISVASSCLGVVLNVCGHFLTMACFYRNGQSVKFVYKFLTLRECEYLEYIRRKDLTLYGEVIRLLHTSKVKDLSEKLLPLPKYTSAVVSRYLKTLSSAYGDLTESYNSHDPDQLRIVANKHQTVFQRDANVGLVKQVIASLTKKRIQRLTKTFLTLSLADMATRVKLSNAKEAEEYLLEMIEDGSIYATIDQHAGMVSFHNNPEKYNTPKMLKKIDIEMKRCIDLNTRLLKMDHDLQVKPQYIQRVMNMVHMDDAGKGDEIMG